MIRYFQKTITKRRPKKLENFKVGSWVYVENPSEDEQETLEEKFGVEKSMIEDALDPNEVPRLEEEDGNIYIFARAPIEKEKRATTATVLIVIGESFVMTISSGAVPSLEEFVSGKIDFNTTQKTRFFLQIFSQMDAEYTNFISRVNRSVRAKSINLEKIRNDDITEFVRFEITLNDFLSALVPMNTVLKRLLSRRKIALYEEDRDLMEDLSLSLEQLVDTCRGNIKAIVNIREAYSTILTNSLNGTIRVLTILTVVLTVPTLIASLFGMNVPVPLAHSAYGFYIVLVISLTVSGLALFGFFKTR